jgi:hypothetical protein
MRWEAGNFPEWAECQIWHVEECRLLDNVIWVDDETAKYCQFAIVNNILEEWTTQARKIVMLDSRTLVLINPLDDVSLYGTRIERKKKRPLLLMRKETTFGK